jgi:hypothetical protein
MENITGTLNARPGFRSGRNCAMSLADDAGNWLRHAFAFSVIVVVRDVECWIRWAY